MAVSSSQANSASASSSTPSPATTKFFDKWRREFSLMTGYGISPEERVFAIARSNCETWKRDLMTYSPPVVFMLKHLKLVGADVRPEHLPCIPCDNARAGGFAHDQGAVVLCQGSFVGKKHMEHTIVHELVHMYDHAKFNVNWRDLRHHACSEIRANNLSGDCKWLQEMQRGVVAFSKQHQACVRRRAILSLQANPSCPDEATAQRVVDEVWESCFNDTRPFDEVY